MKFKESLRSCAYENYVQFKGRASRSEFWWFMLALLLFNVFFIAVAVVFPGLGTSMIGGLSLVMLCPYASSLTRRLHDVGLSGWWVAAAFAASLVTSSLAAIPEFEWTRFIGGAAFLLLFIAAALPGQKAANRFGEPPQS